MSTNANLPVQIGDRRYVVDLKGMQRNPIKSTRQMQDASREHSDRSLDSETIWKRTQSDFVMGAGQNYLDQEDQAERRQFRTSKGIDVWDRRQLCLLPATSEVTNIGDASSGDMIVTASGIYACSGSEIEFSSSGTSWSACSGEAGTIYQLTAIGGHVYAAGSSTLRRCTDGATAFSTFGSLTPNVIGTGGGRLVGADGAELYEILNDGSKTDIYTHFDGTNFAWTKIIAAPNGIYCFGDDAGRSVAWLLTVVDATGELSAPYPCLQMPDGEFIRDVLFYGGVLVLATNLGVRLAQINGSGFLTAGPLIEIGDVECLATDGSFIWFGWSDFDGTSTGIGRMDPSRFTEVLAPAYAFDLYAVDQGDVLAVCSFGGRRFFMYDDGAGGAVRRQSDDLLGSGTFHSGVVTYGTPELKAVHSVEGYWDALPAGANVYIQVLDGLGGAVLPGGVNNGTSNSTSERGALTDTAVREEIEVLVTLQRATDTTTGPCLRRWTLRSMVLPYRTEEFILPIMLYEEVIHKRNGGDVRVSFDVLDETNYLLGLMEGRTPVDVIIGDVTKEMMVDAVGVSPQVEGVGFTRWTPQQDWMEGTWAIRLLTIEPTT